MDAVSLSTFLKAVGGQPHLKSVLPSHIHSISIDSRTLRPNDVFWAIQGLSHDGHHFVKSAIDQGASACIVDESYKQIANPTEPVIYVSDTLGALQNFANWHRRRHDITTIGITGSYGKTTTRELIYCVLATRQPGLQSQSNYNNEIGVPLTLLNLESQHRFLIVEMGAGKPNDIAPLANIASPKIGIITGIGPAHIAGFHHIDQIVQTKGDLVASLPTDGLAVLPGDSPWKTELAQRANCRAITVGFQPQNTYQADHIKCSNQTVSFRVKNQRYQLPFGGRHFVTAALSAIAIGLQLGYTPDEIQEGFSYFQPVSGRCRVVQYSPWTIINDAYNANPDSCRAACDLLAGWQTSGRRFFVLGDMLELGDQSEKYHQDLGELAASHEIDYLLALGQYAEQVRQGANRIISRQTRVFTFPKHAEVIESLKGLLKPSDVVLVKGSRGMHMEYIVKALKEHAEFSDVAKAA